MPVTTTTNNPRQPTDDPEDEELEDLDDLDGECRGSGARLNLGWWGVEEQARGTLGYGGFLWVWFLALELGIAWMTGITPRSHGSYLNLYPGLAISISPHSYRFGYDSSYNEDDSNPTRLILRTTDLLPTFTKPPTASTSTSNSKPQPTASSSQPTRPSTNNLDSASDAHADDNEPFDPDFEAELTKGMESLLRELGMNPPPGGPLPTGNRGQSSALPTGANPMAGGLGMGDLEGEGSAELQALLSKLMEGGMDDLDLGALGLGGEAQGEGTQTQGGKGEKLSFQESIERTMKGLKDGAEGAKKVRPGGKGRQCPVDPCRTNNACTSSSSATSFLLVRPTLCPPRSTHFRPLGTGGS